MSLFFAIMRVIKKERKKNLEQLRKTLHWMKRQPPEILGNIWSTEKKVSSEGMPGLSPHTRVHTQTKTHDFSLVSPSPGGLSTWRTSRLEKPLHCQSERWVYFQSLGVYSIIFEKKKANMRWESGQTVSQEWLVDILFPFWVIPTFLSTFFSMQTCASNFDHILPRTLLLIIIYKGKQGAEAYLRVSPKQEIKMTVTHPFKCKKYILRTPAFFISPAGFIKLHFMYDFVWFLPQRHHTGYNIYQGWCSWEKKHTNYHLLAHLCFLNDKL